ncbi:hypothetical protein AAG906_030675 [Vitis piasezkii]
MTKPQTLEFVIVHNSNSISLFPSLLLQTTQSIDIGPSTPFHPNQSQTVNSNEFILQTHLGLVHETEPNSILKKTHSSNIDSNPNESKIMSSICQLLKGNE